MRSAHTDYCLQAIFGYFTMEQIFILLATMRSFTDFSCFRPAAIPSAAGVPSYASMERSLMVREASFLPSFLLFTFMLAFLRLSKAQAASVCNFLLTGERRYIIYPLPYVFAIMALCKAVWLFWAGGSRKGVLHG